MSGKNLVLSKPTYLTVIPVALLLLGIGLRFYGLGRTLGTGYQGFDEGIILRYFVYSPWENIFARYHMGGINHHVFNTILLKIMVVLFGEENALAIRFPTFIFSIACLWMIYQVALQLFSSPAVARLSLLLAVLLPLHVAWSQTARGYALTMFLSVLMVYATVKLLERPQHAKWGCLLLCAGFLSVYTLLTNVYILFGLACWVLWVLTFPGLIREFEINPKIRKQKVILFAGIFLGILALSCLAYLPLIDQIIEQAKNEQNFINKNYYGHSTFIMILKLIPGILDYIFPGYLQWFLPLLLGGILWGGVVRSSYRLLPVFIFFLPFAVTLVTGTAGYDRNYLFNLPLFIIFLAAGIVAAGRYIDKYVPYGRTGRLVVGGLVACYTLIACSILINKHYPLNKSPNVRLNKQVVEKYTGPFDLIIVPSVSYQLNARGVVKQNLLNILLSGEMTGVKVMTSGVPFIKEYKDPGTGEVKKVLEISSNAFSLETLEVNELPAKNKMITLSDTHTVSVLPEDFESRSAWTKNFSGGRVSLETQHRFAGDFSLLIAGGQKGMSVVQSDVFDTLEIKKNSLAVLVWATRDNETAYQPVLFVKDVQTGGGFRQLLNEKINFGMELFLPEGSPIFATKYWEIGASVGLIPAGKYSVRLSLTAPPGKAVLYDGVRLFFAELS